MVEKHYDIVIIGSGPGGEGAAMKASKSDKRVAVVEQYVQIGGGCTHWGTIPSKALREAVRKYTEFRNNPLFAEMMKGMNFSYQQLLHSAQQVIAKQVALRSGFYERNAVDIIEGQACFVDTHTVSVQTPDGGQTMLKADAFIIATGSNPYHPPDVDFSHPRILDSDTILNLDQTPKSMTIYGAGVIGCEYASLFRNLGLKLNLINTREKLLAFLDDEIIDALSYHLRDQGILIRHNENYEKVEPGDDSVVLHLKSGKKVKTDYLLWANGRTGNTGELGLDKLGISANERQQLDVNDNYQTSRKHIYAVGDVIGPPGLASAAYDQGRFAAQHIIAGESEYKLVQHIPTGIYTSPEISSIGYTERELTAQKIPYEVGHSMFRHLARAQIIGSKVGMLKILFHRETLAILGVHCFGHHASEIIHIGQAIMSQKKNENNLMYFVNTTFNYPTMAEAYRVAALNGLNRLF
ncbi:Si-specific NAD(P)(+) transhydrogenase [candidate division CSSED10-310 bacterium]|uniref:NAD(P)(+) transhydrogenase (Si-specific) n=1 Tax=candidate division CSSED10-310 bacterium TaxID=2855610 RepID=A0ABV6YV62_UNCC1